MMQMNISSFVCCQRIANEKNGEPTIIEPLQTIPVVNLPATYSFCISIGLVEIDKEGNDSFELDFMDPNDHVMHNIGPINLPPAPQEIIDNKSMYGAFMNIDVRNMLFRYEGLHAIIMKGSINQKFLIQVSKHE